MYDAPVLVDSLGSFEWWSAIIGGLAIFLAGLYFLPENLKKIAGEKLKLLIDRSTDKPIKGVFFGFAFTAVIQSSSATTAIVIALVKAGLMSLPQAFAVIIGANLGTTITAFIIGLNISFIAPFLLIAGALAMLFMPIQKGRHIGGVLFGFGALFFGLELMGDALKMLTALPEFSSIVVRYGSNPFLGLLLGTVGTAIVQSSSAFIGILQALYASAQINPETPFTLMVAMPLLFGANIGTTITAALASIGGSVSAKRAAFAHVLFNVIGAILCMALLWPLNWVYTHLFTLMPVDPRMEIAIAHIAFNILAALIVFPLLKPLVKTIKFAIRGDDTHDSISVDFSSLNRSIKGVAPEALLSIVKEKALLLGNWALDAVTTVKRFIEHQAIADHDKVLQYEQSIDQMYEHVSDFMHQMRQSAFEDKELDVFTQILRVIKDIERIGDHCENLIEFFDTIAEKGETLNKEGGDDIVKMLLVAEDMIGKALRAFENDDYELAREVHDQDDVLDDLNRVTRDRHVSRFYHGISDKNRYSAMVYVDILSNIERLGDHAVNIADTVIDLHEKK